MRGTRRIAILFAIVGVAVVLLALGRIAAEPIRRSAAPAEQGSDTVSRADTVTQVAMRNVNFYVTSSAALRIRRLRGEMRSLRGGPILFDDKTSFVIRLLDAEVGLNGSDLSTLLNSHVFAYPGAPLKRLKVHTAGTHLVQSGIMHKIVDIPFEITADVSVTPEGLIRLRPVKTKILGIDGNGLMRAFGLSLEKILDLSKAKGVTVKGNDLYLNPSRLLPPPAIEGRVTGIRIDGDELVQTFGAPGAASALAPPDTAAPAYMFYQGGTLRFGKLLMLDADMQIVALHPARFFGFDLDRYKQQLVAGYSRTLSDFGLEVYMASVETLTPGGGAATRR
jgi:hypothetical protein